MAGIRVCVIGGGPAGLAAALEGKKLGLEIDLYEKGKIGENIRCAEGLIDSFHVLERPEVGTCFKVQEAILKVKREFRVKCEAINLWMIDRREWQCFLAKKALNMGVNIYEDFRVAPEILGKFVKDYDWIIDASGLHSVALSALHLRKNMKMPQAITAQYVIEDDYSHLGNRIKFILFPNNLGYSWIFPKGKDSCKKETINVGIGYFNFQQPGKMIWNELDRICQEERIQGRIIRKFGGVIPIELRKKLQYGKILLVGDAAGCASPVHGGGIDLAVLTGKLAARWAAAKREGDFTHEIRTILEPKIAVEKRLCSVWEEADEKLLEVLAGLLARDYRLDLRVFLKHWFLLLRELKTGARFWSGITRGDWQNGSLRDLLFY